MESESQVFNRVCTVLGFSGNSSFLERETETTSLKQKLVLQEAKEKLGIDAVYIIQTASNALPIPVIYFKKFKSIDDRGVRTLHKRIWNQGKAPLLFVVAPTEIRVYNCFEPPPDSRDENLDEGNRLISRLSQVASEEIIRQKLGEFSREKIDIGGFLGLTDQFNASNRADQHLLRNLRSLRHELIDKGLNYRHVHNLIGRSIFILYLEDRGALTHFQKEFYEGKYSKFVDVLQNKQHTYEYFEEISKHFNGNVFPVTEEEKVSVSTTYLSKLRAFLRGVDPNGQERLWPYSFDVIPIEFISSIYEEFYHFETSVAKKHDGGAHYTPLFLVEFILDQVLPSDNKTPPTILDPACGSGVFLVAAYKRLINEITSKLERRLNPNELSLLLCNNIYGVDINGEAIKVAAFSLYLTMLDYLEPKTLWQHGRLFPNLIDNNLVTADFLKPQNRLNGKHFDIIVGNTPWETGRVATDAVAHFQYRGKTIGDKQIAQAFLWKALDHAKDNSKICLIVTAKGLLFNKSAPNEQFRAQFFARTHTTAIINFAAIRHDIFENAIGPAAAIIYSPLSGEPSPEVLYVVPKYSDEMRKLGAIVVNDTDVKHIPRELLAGNTAVWKAAMWGTARDWQLLNKLQHYPTLRENLRNLNCSIGDGFQVNGGDLNERTWMAELRYCPENMLTQYKISETLQNCPWIIFHRPRERQRYTAPLCLMKAAPSKGQIIAAYSGMDTCFDSNIIGISAKNKENGPVLKLITAFLNSSLAQYFLFLTCSKWGVERDDVLVKEYLDLPLPLLPVESTIAREIISLHDMLCVEASTEKFAMLKRQVDEKIFALFELSEVEKELVQDMTVYTINFFQEKDRSLASARVTTSMISEYCVRIQNTITMLLSGEESLPAKIFMGSQNFIIVAFSLNAKKATEHLLEIKTATIELDEVLETLRKVLTEKISEGIYFVRKLKIYEKRTIYIIKPNENRYWIKAASYEDADGIVADILDAWREKS